VSIRVFRRTGGAFVDYTVQKPEKKTINWSTTGVKVSKHIAFSDAFAISSSCLSVGPHGTTRLPLDGLSVNFIYEIFIISVDKV
jgi:hypothetical protein